MGRKNIKIGLFGFGCVGFGLYEALQKTPSLKTNIKRICVKTKNKQRPILNEHFTFDKNEILFDNEINTVVELIDDADAAFEIVKTALQNGKAVVTANKKMIAEHFTELLDLQKKHNVPLLYEAACCASIPIIRNLEEYYDNDLLQSFEGIINGSTNYILGKLQENNLTFSEALSLAQKLGFAESNPHIDVSGEDAVNKLGIILNHAFGIVIDTQQIVRHGITNIKKEDIAFAKEKNYKITKFLLCVI